MQSLVSLVLRERSLVGVFLFAILGGAEMLLLFKLGLSLLPLKLLVDLLSSPAVTPFALSL